MDKSKDKNEQIKGRLVSKTTQNEIYKFLSKLREYECKPGLCDFLNLHTTIGLVP